MFHDAGLYRTGRVANSSVQVQRRSGFELRNLSERVSGPGPAAQSPRPLRPVCPGVTDVPVLCGPEKSEGRALGRTGGVQLGPPWASLGGCGQPRAFPCTAPSNAVLGNLGLQCLWLVPAPPCPSWARTAAQGLEDLVGAADLGEITGVTLGRCHCPSSRRGLPRAHHQPLKARRPLAACWEAGWRGAGRDFCCNSDTCCSGQSW